MSATEKLVEFRGGNHLLRGMIHLPKVRAGMRGRGARAKAGGRKRAGSGAPGVLVLHGFTGNRIEGGFLPVKLSRALADAGVASLRFDFAGSGESEGRFVDMTPLTELEDARAALSYFARRKGVDSKRLGVVGHSLGGFVAGMLLEDARLRSGVLLAAPAELGLLIDDYSTPEAEREFDERGYVVRGVHLVGKRFVEDARKADPRAGLRLSGAHVLVIHGTADESVPLEHASMLEEAIRNRAEGSVGARGEVVLVPDMAHTPGTPEHEEEYIRRTVAWFGETLG